VQTEDGLFQISDPENFPTPEGYSTSSLASLRKSVLHGRDSLYLLCKVVLGYDKLNERVHLPMCRFVVQTRKPGGRRMMLMPRGHFKTTIWTIADSIQEVCLDPNIRILIVADTGTNASRFMREIQLHFERNELFRRIFSDIIPPNFNKALWNQYEMEVVRKSISRDPTIDAIGALGGSESRHYHMIKADDLVTEKCIRSDVEMDKVTKWTSGLEPLLTNIREDRIDFIGSRKKKGDTYEVQEKSYGEGSEEKDIGPFAKKKGDLLVFTRSAEENGKVIFPESISQEFLVRLRKIDPERYHAQFGNSPKVEGLNTFPFSSLRYYRYTEDGRILCIHEGKVLLEVHPSSLERILLYDPSVAEKKTSSKNAMHVVGKGSHPFRIVLDSRVGHFQPDEAVDQLFEWDKKWNPSFHSIESRGFQGWVKYWLEERAERDGLPYLQVVEWPPKGHPSSLWAKAEHIKALQPIIRAEALWVHESMKDLIDEIEFYPNVRWDDGLDALAQGLTYWPASIDEFAIETMKEKEMDYLEAAALGLDPEVERDRQKPPWDEMEFLRSISADGYTVLH
jgi:hypothetical protein